MEIHELVRVSKKYHIYNKNKHNFEINYIFDVDDYNNKKKVVKNNKSKIIKYRKLDIDSIEFLDD